MYVTKSTSDSRQSILFVLEQGLICGGAERVASLLINEWVKRDIDVTLVTRGGPEEDFYSLSDKVVRKRIGCKYRSPNIFALIYSTIVRVIRLRRTLKSTKPKVAIAFMTASNIRLILASIGLPIRMVVCERNDVHNRKISIVQKLLRYLLYRFSDVVTANTEESARALSNFCGDAKVVYLPNPVKIQYAGDDERQNIILAVGRLHPIKNHKLLIAAFNAISAEHRNWRLVIAGDGDERDNLNLFIQSLKIVDQVQLVGQVSNVDELYKRSSIYAITSFNEGMPNTLLEAMSHGLPVVAPRNLSGALAFVTHGCNGYLFNQNEVSSLAESLNKLIMQPQLRQLFGYRARSALAGMSPENIVDKWSDILFCCVE
jgi:GalNAc-alpha-(1->4)-GalNAc-alpha-(1->3)-diNAcBac-PP-undecaprenol alpha-1,4-N-acetyl-D-galactosaminyltransferase